MDGFTRLYSVKSVRMRSYLGPHFPAFWLNMERYRVSLHIQSECWKMRTKITPDTDIFHAVLVRSRLGYKETFYRNSDILVLFVRNNC